MFGLWPLLAGMTVSGTGGVCVGGAGELGGGDTELLATAVPVSPWSMAKGKEEGVAFSSCYPHPTLLNGLAIEFSLESKNATT